MARADTESFDLTVGPMFRLVYHLAGGVLRLLFSIRWFNLERVPTSGPVIVASNHVSMLDPPAIGLGFPPGRTTRFMAKEELFRHQPVKWFVQTVNAFPVKRGTADRAAIKIALGILSAGGIVGIFPEGTRVRAGETGEAQQGAAFLAAMAGATIVPVGVSGSDRLWPSLRRPRFARVTIVFGDPIDASSVSALPRTERVGALTAALVDGIAAAKAESDRIQLTRDGAK